MKGTWMQPYTDVTVFIKRI